MSELFDVTTDYLLKDEIEEERQNEYVETKNNQGKYGRSQSIS